MGEIELARTPTRRSGIERVLLSVPGHAVAIEHRRAASDETLARLMIFADMVPLLIEAIDWARQRHWHGSRLEVGNVHAGRSVRLAVAVTGRDDARSLVLQRTGEDGVSRGAPLQVDEPEFDVLEAALLELVTGGGARRT